MNNLTPVQLKAIQTWTEQRDALLREIGNYSIELESLQKSTKGESLALVDLQKSAAATQARIETLLALEIRTRGSVATDIAELEARKSRLEIECAQQEEKLEGVAVEYKLIVDATKDLQSAHDTMKDQAAIVDRVVGEIIQTSQLHTSEMKTIMSEIGTLSDQVLDRGNENLSQTKIILEKLPKYIFELQKPIPVRRMYAPPRGTEIKPGDAQ